MSLPEELFPVVDDDGNEISLAPRSVCHDGKSMLLHPVVHLHLLNPNGDLFLQKRAMTKDLLPGMWDTSVGGHMSSGETAEELGLKDLTFHLNKKYKWQSPRERELVYSFTGSCNDIPVTNPDEIDEGRFWEMEEIKESLGKNIFTPNFEFEFNMLYITHSDI